MISRNKSTPNARRVGKQQAQARTRRRRGDRVPRWYNFLLIASAALIIGWVAFFMAAEVTLVVTDRCIQCVLTGNDRCGLSRLASPRRSGSGAAATGGNRPAREQATW